MDHLQLRRLSGAALVLAAPACLLGGLLHPVEDGEAHSASILRDAGPDLGSLSLLVGTVLLVLGLPGVYGWLAPRLGRLGLVGFVLYVVGNVLSALPHLVVMAFIGPQVAREHPELVSESDMVIGSAAFETEQLVTGLMFMLGFLLLSIALLRAPDVPAWIGAAGIAATVLLFVPLPVMPVVTGLQVELLRGVVAATLGLMAIRSTRAATGAVASSQPLAGAAR